MEALLKILTATLVCFPHCFAFHWTRRNINEPFFVGLDSEDRVCGGETRFPIGTLYLFIDTFLRFSVEGLGRIRRENGVTETGMGVYVVKQYIRTSTGAIPSKTVRHLL